MEGNRRGALVVGVLLILIGAWFLAIEMVPGWHDRVYGAYGWPLFVIGAGVVLLVIGILSGAYGMAIPAAIVSGVGGLLYWQNLTGRWGSWAYAWALIPAFVGVGIILAGLMQGRPHALWEGGWLILIGLVVFAVFGSALGGISVLGPYWPVLLIVWGVLVLGRALVRLART